MTDVWSERAQAFRESAAHREGPDLDLLVEWCEPGDGVQALDVATGGGHVARRLSEAGCDVVSVDPAPGMHPTVVARAEEIPFADASFELVFCDHGATSFTDPDVTVPEVARVLKPGGGFVFDIASPFIWCCWPDGDEPAGHSLTRPYFGGGRTVLPDDDGPSVEWQLTYGDWIRLFRASGFVIEDLIELRPPEDASTTYTTFATHGWARDYPGENIWKLRKER